MRDLEVIETVTFPDPRQADEDGLVAIGGNFQPETLLAAYRAGIFPWPSDFMARAWFSPDPRMVLVPECLHLNRSLRKRLRKGELQVSFDAAFNRVIGACAEASRPDDAGTWIVSDLARGFRQLHRQGYAHSVETWRGDELVGGLYGLSIGGMFCGESMFHKTPDASKIALVALVQLALAWDFRFIDCQVYTDHLASLGAEEWPRQVFLDELNLALERPTQRGRWSETAAQALSYV